MDKKDDRGSSLRQKLVSVYTKTGIVSPLLEQDFALTSTEEQLLRIYDNLLYSTNYAAVDVKMINDYSLAYKQEIPPILADLLIMIDKGFRYDNNS